MRDLVKKLRMYPEGIGHSVRLPAADYIEHLEAENERLRGAVAEAVYMLDPEAEDVLKGAGIYRIVSAYEGAGGVLPDDLMDALQEMKGEV